MKVLFLSIGDVSSLKMSDHGVYTDLVRKIHESGHEVYVVCSRERRLRLQTEVCTEIGIHVLRVQTGNITKTNMIEKGIATLLIGIEFQKAIKMHWKNICFDLVLYSTPPITLTNVIRWTKKKFHAYSYLMLKDIFPQNAVDLDMIQKTGPKSLIYKYFRQKEKLLYYLSDHIGCMSEANRKYVIVHNPDIDCQKVGICPNAVEIIDMSVSQSERESMRKKYGIPLDKTVFVYGGNLGKPQGIPFLIECLKKLKGLEDAFFLIVGSGTEFESLQNYVNSSKQRNLKLLRQLPKEDYERMVGSCDVGMIFLDHRFTIPNFPSRLLSYMQARMPVIAITDPNTDIGKIIVGGNFGWWCESNDAENVKCTIEKILKEDLRGFGNHSWNYMKEHYSVDVAYESIMKSLAKEY